MINKLTDTLDAIKADDKLKTKTMSYLHNEIKNRAHHGKRLRFRTAAICSAILFFVFTGGVSYGVYVTPAAYVDMDVNPSIGLTLNRFDRVVKLTAYNEDGAEVLSGLSLKNKTYDEAAKILLDEIIKKGYLVKDGTVSVSVQADAETENNMLILINDMVEASLSEHQADAQSDVYAVDETIRQEAHGCGMSPTKYLAIAELQNADPAAEFEYWAERSLSEIESHIHGGHRGGNQEEIIVPESFAVPSTNNPSNCNPSNNNNRGSHHGRGRH